MKISAKMITYGRVRVLEEALFSFLNQNNLNNHELIIVNDYPLQELIFDHPNVKIFNLKETFKTIGEKENFTIENCSGDLIAVWDDDDIALPCHLDNILEYWDKDTNIIHWAKGVYYNEPEISTIGWIGNSGIVYSKKIWEKIGKSPIMNAGGDTVLVNKITEFGGVVHAFPPDDKVSWFYRWSLPVQGGVYHQSGLGFDKEGQMNIVERNALFIEEQRQKGNIPTGKIYLNPSWRHNYTEMLKNYIKK